MDPTRLKRSLFPPKKTKVCSLCNKTNPLFYRIHLRPRKYIFQTSNWCIMARVSELLETDNHIIRPYFRFAKHAKFFETRFLFIETLFAIRHSLMLLWFADLMNVTEEVTIHRPNVSTLLSSAFIRGAFIAIFDLWKLYSNSYTASLDEVFITTCLIEQAMLSCYTVRTNIVYSFPVSTSSTRDFIGRSLLY